MSTSTGARSAIMVDFDFQFSPHRRFKGGGPYGVLALAMVLAAVLAMGLMIALSSKEAGLVGLTALRAIF